MHYVTIEYARDLSRWWADLEDENEHFWLIFEEAARNSKMRWEALDYFQKYQFKLVETEDGPRLRFLGVDTRYGEYVAATQDQMVLGAPA